MINTIKNGVTCFNTIREQAVKLFLDDKQQYNSVTLGSGSYISNISLEFGGGRANHVLIGNYTSIANWCVFLSGMNHDHRQVSTYPFDDFLRTGGATNTYVNANRYQIVIGHDVWIGRGVTILGGVRIGNGAVVGTQSVVTKDVPDYAVVAGNPARIVKYRFPLDVLEKLEQIKWWYWPRAQIHAQLPLMKNPRDFADKFYPNRLRAPAHPLGNQLRMLKSTGKRIFFIATDTGVPNPVFEHVFDRYLQTYKKSDNTLLIFGYTGGGGITEN